MAGVYYKISDEVVAIDFLSGLILSLLTSCQKAAKCVMSFPGKIATMEILINIEGIWIDLIDSRISKKCMIIKVNHRSNYRLRRILYSDHNSQ